MMNSKAFSFCTDIGYLSVNKHDEQLCGDHVELVEHKKNLALINARPKKVLHFQTPQDLFEQNLVKCCT